MKLLALLLVAVTVAQANIQPSPVFGYLKNSVAEAERIREREERILSQRIVGGVPAAAQQYPYQAGLLIDVIGFTGTGVCGGSLISPSRVATAAHCWFDGINQSWRFTVVLGSVFLFTGGTRTQTSAIITHPQWTPSLARNDAAVIYLPAPVATSSSIAPIALPSGSELFEDFAGSAAIASGFGLTSDDGAISTTQSLSHVSLNVITNSVCSPAFPFIIQSTNICTSGIGGVGTCRGDSGGPLAVTRNGRPILIGITSFGSFLGCQASMPAAYARVTSYIGFLTQHQD